MPSLNPAPPADSKTGLMKLVKTPTILILREFRKVCGTSGTKIDFDQDQEVFDKLKEILKRLDMLIETRGLVYAAKNCTDGKSRDSLVEFLGVDMLLKQPRQLIRALLLEKADNDLIVTIAKADPDEIAGLDCSTDECKAKRKDAFQKKNTALENLKVRKEEDSVRQNLLSAVRAVAN